MHKRFKRVNRVALLAAAAVFFLAAAGCGNFYLEQFRDSNSDYGSVRATRGDSESGAGRTFDRARPFRLTDAGSQAGSKAGLRAGSRAAGADIHNNERLFISEQAMYQLDKIQGIAAAAVIITDRNAYVGVMTDQSSTGTYTSGGSPDVNNAGTSEGVYDIYTGRAYAGTRKTAPRLLATRTNNLYTASGSEKLSPKLTRIIESSVRNMHPHVQRVFISPNRDYVNFLNSFATDYWNGRRLDNRLDEFNRTIRSIGHIWS